MSEDYIKLPKDVICYLGTFVNPFDLLNFFLVSKTFNENTNQKYHFWFKKLLRDFDFSYDSLQILSIIKKHYRILYKAKRYGVSRFYPAHSTDGELHCETLRKYLIYNMEKFLLKCQYVFSSEEDKKECYSYGKRYGKYIFCQTCRQKLSTAQLIKDQPENSIWSIF